MLDLTDFTPSALSAAVFRPSSIPVVIQAYRQVLDDVVAAAGIPETAVHDVRGNHDVYDVPAR